MTRRRRKSSGDRPHQRFMDWLLAGSSGEPPRDVAVHAASCPECQARIAAMDELAMVDLGLAGLPEASAEATGIAWPFLARRAAMAGSVLAAALAIAFIGWRIFLAPDAPIAVLPALGASPTQEVLGGTSSQQPTPTPGAESLVPSPTLPVAPSGPTAEPTLGPPAPGQTPFPPVYPTTAPTFGPGVTPRPTSGATASARPSSPATPRPTIAPTPLPTPPPTPAPTPQPTPEPTPEATPVVPLPQCSDLIDNDGDSLIDFGILPTNDPGCSSLLDNDESNL